MKVYLKDGSYRFLDEDSYIIEFKGLIEEFLGKDSVVLFEKATDDKIQEAMDNFKKRLTRNLTNEIEELSCL